MFNKYPKRSGVYHITDNIEQLELLVHFRHVNSLLKLPKFDLNKNLALTTGKQPAKHDSNKDDTEDSATMVRIRWQQKLLSPSEIELYKDVHNCSTEAQKKYHQWLVEEDDISVAEQQLMEDSSARKSKMKRRSKRLKRSQQSGINELQRQHEIFTYVQEDNFKPPNSVEELNTKRVPTDTQVAEEPVEMMYIYAAIYPDTQLVTLKWYPRQHMLIIYPDFNSIHESPYFIEIDTDYRHLYAYGLQHISKQRKRQSDAANFLRLPELPTHWNLERELNAQFCMPPKRTTRIALLFEIREACNFEYDNLHVRYHINLPPNTLLEEGLLHASTHASSCFGSVSGRCHFGYTWQLTLLCEEDFQHSDLLHVYFELISVDTWERERVEGYAHYSTHLSAGCDAVQLQCLRPVDSFMDALNRYFIGGRRKFDFVQFFTPPSALGEERTMHNRYGCRMQNTGQLDISCQRFSQRNCELLQPCRNPTSGMTLDDIMLAYRKALKRLEAVVLK